MNLRRLPAEIKSEGVGGVQRREKLLLGAGKAPFCCHPTGQFRGRHNGWHGDRFSCPKACLGLLRMLHPESELSRP